MYHREPHRRQARQIRPAQAGPRLPPAPRRDGDHLRLVRLGQVARGGDPATRPDDHPRPADLLDHTGPGRPGHLDPARRVRVDVRAAAAPGVLGQEARSHPGGSRLQSPPSSRRSRSSRSRQDGWDEACRGVPVHVGHGLPSCSRTSSCWPSPSTCSSRMRRDGSRPVHSDNAIRPGDPPAPPARPCAT